MTGVWDENWLERRYYGGSLPPEAERELHLAARAYQEDARAEAHLRRTVDLAPAHLAGYIGLYKFHFYKGRLAEALPYACRCLELAGADLGLPSDWHLVTPDAAPFGNYEAGRARFYLFVLKAYGYVQMRLGNAAEGMAAMRKLLELDPSDKLGAGALLAVWERGGVDDAE